MSRKSTTLAIVPATFPNVNASMELSTLQRDALLSNAADAQAKKEEIKSAIEEIRLSLEEKIEGAKALLATRKQDVDACISQINLHFPDNPVFTAPVPANWSTLLPDALRIEGLVSRVDSSRTVNWVNDLPVSVTTVHDFEYRKPGDTVPYHFSTKLEDHFPHTLFSRKSVVPIPVNNTHVAYLVAARDRLAVAQSSLSELQTKHASLWQLESAAEMSLTNDAIAKDKTRSNRRNQITGFLTKKLGLS